MNQRLEDSVGALRQRLRFLPECEVAEELAELEAHLRARTADYEAAGESTLRAEQLALEKWGDVESSVRAIYQRWLLRQPLVVGALVGVVWLGLAVVLRFGILSLGGTGLVFFSLAYFAAALSAGIAVGAVLGHRVTKQRRAVAGGIFVAALFFVTHDPLSLALMLGAAFLGVWAGRNLAPKRKRRGLRT